MERSLLGFVELLRRHRLPVSTACSMGALRSQALLGFASASRLREGLALNLVQRQADRALFDQCFEEYFLRRQPAAPLREPALAPLLAAAVAVDPALQATVSGSGLAPLLSDDPVERELFLLQAAADSAADGIRLFTQRGLYLRRLLEALRTPELDILIHQGADHAHPEPRALAEALARRRQHWQEAAGAYIDAQLTLRDRVERREQRERWLMNTPILRLDDRERRRLGELVQQLARNLASRPRPRPDRRRGRLDVAATLRASRRFDGLPVVPRWRRPRPRREVLYILCDVSGSMAVHARFLLLLLQALQDRLPRVRSFVFTGELVEVSAQLKGRGAATAIEAVLKRHGGGASDYGRALADFSRLGLGTLDRHASVLLLGDARNNMADPRAALLAAVARRAGRVIWLNPEPRALWNTGDSVLAAYARHCDRVHECATLAQLARAITNLTRGPAGDRR